MNGKEEYDDSWAQGNEILWDEKFKEWEKRDWLKWFETHLSFPFLVELVEDSGETVFHPEARSQPFRLGHTMKVLAMVEDDPHYGVIVKVREGRRIGYVPLADTEVISLDDENYWPVREYASWIANR